MPARFATPQSELVRRLATLQRKFDAGQWSGTEALEFVRETHATRKRLSGEFGMTELEIEIALHELGGDETP